MDNLPRTTSVWSLHIPTAIRLAATPQLSSPTRGDMKLLKMLQENLLIFTLCLAADVTPNWVPCSASYTSQSVIKLISMLRLTWQMDFIHARSSVKKFTTVCAPSLLPLLQGPGNHICSAISLKKESTTINQPTHYQTLPTVSMVKHLPLVSGHSLGAYSSWSHELNPSPVFHSAGCILSDSHPTCCGETRVWFMKQCRHNIREEQVHSMAHPIRSHPKVSRSAGDSCFLA